MESELAEFFSVYIGYLLDAGYTIEGLSIQNGPKAVPPWDSCYYTRCPTPRPPRRWRSDSPRMGARFR